MRDSGLPITSVMTFLSASSQPPRSENGKGKQASESVEGYRGQGARLAPGHQPH